VAAQLEGVSNDWAPVLQRWRGSHAGRATLTAIDGRLAAGAVIYPSQVFKALATTPLAATRVVILGQDPYHGPGQAEGLAFSVAPGVKAPPSLRNIFKELVRDLAIAPPTTGSLVPWAEQGVLLLNTCLTVEEGRPASHAKFGWQALTDEILTLLLQSAVSRVFMLWGAHAQARVSASAFTGRHCLLQCNHPSPLSAARGPAPFVGCGHFGLANQFLVARGLAAVDWRLP
jgi:uracil-DNA glycosylase